MRRQWLVTGAVAGAVTMLSGAGIGMAMGAYVTSALPRQDRFAYSPPDLGAAVAARRGTGAAPFTIKRSELAYAGDAAVDGAAPRPYRAVVY